MLAGSLPADLVGYIQHRGFQAVSPYITVHEMY
jgi:hypothetical protein